MKVLFLCTANSARSQMAEGFLRKYAGDQIEVFSAGLQPTRVNPYAIRAMAEVGIDIRHHTSDHVNAVVGLHYFNTIITVCADADQNCPSGVYGMGREKLHWPFDDPAAVTGNDEQILQAFRRVRDQIDAKVQTWVGQLRQKRTLASR
ncbi:MAG: arsenate reductase ArsC [Phototrophicaceae bacterium]